MNANLFTPRATCCFEPTSGTSTDSTEPILKPSIPHMKPKIEWRHDGRTLKLADTDYEIFPSEGDIVEVEEDGELHRFRASIDSAVVDLELAPDDAVGPADGPAMPVASTLTSDQQEARKRKAERLAAEATAEKQKVRKFTVATKKKK